MYCLPVIFLGFAKLFCFNADKVLLVRTFNEQVCTVSYPWPVHRM